MSHDFEYHPVLADAAEFLQAATCRVIGSA